MHPRTKSNNLRKKDKLQLGLKFEEPREPGPRSIFCRVHESGPGLFILEKLKFQSIGVTRERPRGGRLESFQKIFLVFVTYVIYSDVYNYIRTNYYKLF